MYESLKIEVTEIGFQTFLEISVYLTGFTKNELLATGMHETYYYTIMKEPDQDNVREFFKEAQSILDEYGGDENRLNEQIGARLIPPEKYIEMAKRIMLLWYTGIWTTINIVKGEKKPISEMVSAESYAQGLIWAAAETHPAGAKQPGYASWSLPPL